MAICFQSNWSERTQNGQQQIQKQQEHHGNDLKRLKSNAKNNTQNKNKKRKRQQKKQKQKQKDK